MPWAKIDDSFHGHPKVTNLSLAAVGLWTLALTWSANYLTDGLVTERNAIRLGGTLETIDELVACGLWERVGNNFQFHDWAHYQPLKVDVLREREQARDRMRGVRASKKGVQPNIERTESELPKDFAGTAPEVRSTPTDPAVPEGSKEPVARATRGTRIPADFAITDDLRDWARSKAASVDLARETEKFVNFWTAKAGSGATKNDWDLTWKNWMLRAVEYAQQRPGAEPPRSTRRVLSGRVSSEVGVR